MTIQIDGQTVEVDGVRYKREEEESKPCPFCDRSDISICGYVNYYARCLMCEAQGPLSTTKKGAREAWNERA